MTAPTPTYAADADLPEVFALSSPTSAHSQSPINELSALQKALNDLQVVLNQTEVLLNHFTSPEAAPGLMPAIAPINAALNEISGSLLNIHLTLANLDTQSAPSEFADTQSMPMPDPLLAGPVFQSGPTPALVATILIAAFLAFLFLYKGIRSKKNPTPEITPEQTL